LSALLVVLSLRYLSALLVVLSLRYLSALLVVLSLRYLSALLVVLSLRYLRTSVIPLVADLAAEHSVRPGSVAYDQWQRDRNADQHENR
jgi:hypothetical protein